MQLLDTNSKKDIYKRKNMNIGSGVAPSQYLFIPILLIIGMFGYGINFLFGFSVYPDEFGYWSTAAHIVGYDWKPVTGLGSYYSFGYSLLLTPILWIFKGGVPAFRAAIFLNAFLQCVSFLLLYKIAFWFESGRDKNHAYIAAGIGALYPAYTYFSQTTMSESLLTFIYILVIYLLIRYLEEPKWYRLLGLSLAMTYLYLVHMRTIGVLLIGFVLLFLFLITDASKRRYWPIAIVILAVGILMVYYLKPVIQERIFAYSTDLEANDFSGQFKKIESYLNLKKVIELIYGFIGKITYLGLASFGLFFTVILESVRSLKEAMANREDEDIRKKNKVFIYIVFTALAQVAVTTIGCGEGHSVDGLLYGRYNEYVLPVFISVGAILLLYKPPKRILRYAPIIINVILTVSVLVLIKFKTIEGVNTFRVPAFGYVWKITGNNPYYSLIGLLTVATLIYIMLLLFSKIKDKKPNLCFCFIFILFIETGLGVICNTDYTYVYSRSDQVDSRIVSWINENSDLGSNIVYVHGNENAFIDVIQFGLYDRTISIISNDETEKLQSGDIVITYGDNEDFANERNDSKHIMDTNQFKLYVIGETHEVNYSDSML